MAAPTSSFLEKLRPEIRLRIYGYVFGSSRVIKLASSNTALGMRIDPTDCVKYSFPPPEPDTCLDISVLLSNKVVFTEAPPVLYDEKIIRGSTDDFEELLQQPDFVERARHIEVADCIGHYQDKNFHSVLRRLQVLPQVRSFVILSDCLGMVDRKVAGAAEYLTVPQFCGIAHLGEVTCIDVGFYQLHGMFEKFRIVNRRLREMWPSVRSSPKDYDAYRDLDSILKRWSLRSSSDNHNYKHLCIAWASQASFRCWVGLHDLLISMTMSGELDQLRVSQLPVEKVTFLRLKRYSRTTRPYASFDAKHLIDGFAERSVLGQWRLRDMKVGDDPGLLSWATEYLSANIHTYDAPLPVPQWRRNWTHRKSHWAEADGSLCTIEYHYIHRRNSFSSVDPVYICHPTRPLVVLSRESASCFIGTHTTSLEGVLAFEWRTNFPGLSDLELRQVIYLCLSLIRICVDAESGDFTLHDRWSSLLLRRYVLASGLFLPNELDHATVDDLRTVVKRVLTVLASPEERLSCGLTQAEITTYTPPPTDLDDDVFLSFAWRFGPLLACAWREYVATANSSSMDLG
jgi:hypothetical protein